LELTRTLKKTLEDKLAYSDNAIIDNTILNNEIDKLEKIVRTNLRAKGQSRADQISGEMGGIWRKKQCLFFRFRKEMTN
jgi:hypothetical protein